MPAAEEIPPSEASRPDASRRRIPATRAQRQHPWPGHHRRGAGSSRQTRSGVTLKLKGTRALSAGTKPPLRRHPPRVLVLALPPRLWVFLQGRRRPQGTAFPSQLLEGERGGPWAAGAEAPPRPRSLPDSPRLLCAAVGPSSFCATVRGGGLTPGSSCGVRVGGGGSRSGP